MEKIQPILTRERIIAADACDGLGDVLTRQQFGPKILMVCDDTTWVAAGESLMHRLDKRFRPTPYSLGARVSPLLSHATQLAQQATDYDGLVAIGSGTINDIVKHAATLASRPYAAIATAASMNGYVSAAASLIEHGAKHSHFAQPPRAVIADLTILAASPKRLTRAGLADTLCRSTVEADMMLSHYLLGTDYPRSTFDRLRAHEPVLLMHATALRDNDPAALKLLMAALFETGDAMADHGSSAIASQGEHMIAHTAEMLYPAEVRNTLHGELIAVTTLTMARLQQEMLGQMPRIKSMPEPEAQFMRLFGDDLGPILSAAYAAKTLSIDQAMAINVLLARDWPYIQQEITSITRPPASIERAFIKTRLATSAKESKITRLHYQNACNYAHLTRDRFTFLDLAAMAEKRI